MGKDSRGLCAGIVRHPSLDEVGLGADSEVHTARDGLLTRLAVKCGDGQRQRVG